MLHLTYDFPSDGEIDRDTLTRFLEKTTGAVHLDYADHNRAEPTGIWARLKDGD